MLMAYFLFLCCFLLAPQLAAAVTVTMASVEPQHLLMRREDKDFIFIGGKAASNESSPTPAPRYPLTGELAVHGAFPGEMDMFDSTHFPAFDFPRGQENTNSCTQTTPPTSNADEPVHVKMTQMGLCRYAAENTPGARLPRLNEADFHVTASTLKDGRSEFALGDILWNERPVGCYAVPCVDEPEMVCYHWNTLDVEPNTTGTGSFPICIRHYFVNGTATSGDVSNGCPRNYEPVMNESDCHADAGLLTYCVGYPFLTGDPNPHCTQENLTVINCEATWREKHNDHPIGCYIAPLSHRSYQGDGCVYFNFVETGFEIPTNANGLIGTPICRISSSTHWVGSSNFTSFS